MSVGVGGVSSQQLQRVAEIAVPPCLFICHLWRCLEKQACRPLSCWYFDHQLFRCHAKWCYVITVYLQPLVCLLTMATLPDWPTTGNGFYGSWFGADSCSCRCTQSPLRSWRLTELTIACFLPCWFFFLGGDSVEVFATQSHDPLLEKCLGDSRPALLVGGNGLCR